VWDLSQLHIFATADTVRPVTRNCETKLQEYGRDDFSKLAAFVRCLSRRSYHKSEWARNSTGIWLPCDVHRLHFNETTEREDTRACRFYGKFCVHAPSVNALVGFCSLRLG
jgi:hypothetical protein